MDHLVNLYRKRYLPDELIHLKDDKILMHADNLIITSWNTLKPRTDISYGISAYFMEEGFKVSKILNEQHELVYWYCDIIKTIHEPETNNYIFHDLLVDVLIYPDGTVHVADLDEVGDLLERGLFEVRLAAQALKTTDRLLKIIDSGKFRDYQALIEQQEG